MRKLLSIIVPCYNEEESLSFLVKELIEVFKMLDKEYCLDSEVLFINDGSKDNTLKLLRELSEMDKRMHYISFSRNFGKESAIYAGFQSAKGDYVAIMDADLQDPPSLLPQMCAAVINEGYERVATRRLDRKGEPKIRSYFARCFYKVINKISDADIMDGARDFQLMTRKVVDAILQMGEYNRFSKGIFGWIGFDTKWISYKNIERVAGVTKWSFIKLLVYSIEGITAFSTIPLMLSSFFGVFFCFVSFLMICVIVFKTIVFGDPVTGWPSMICIIMFLGGIQLFCIGILGQYISKTYLETKRRPIYIVGETDLK